MAFVHLHNHTVFSMLDGATRIQDMVNRAVELGMPAVAITDHGYMYGVPDLSLACDAVNHNTPEYKTWSHDKAFLEKGRRDELEEPDPEKDPAAHAQYVKDMAGWDEKGNIDDLKPPMVIKPIFGCEVYFTPDDTLARDKKPELYHMILLAKDQEGYVNLMQTVSEAAVDGFYYKPRVTLDNLRRHAKGMICTSACIAGIIPKYIDRGDMDGAVKWAETFRDIFDPGDFYIEIQDHGIATDSGITDEQLSRILIDIANQIGVKVIATNDFHYLRREDASVQDVIMCIGMNAKIDDPNRLRMTGSEFYMKTEEEMRALFPYCPEACDNTLEIADKCYVELDWDSIILPRFPLLDEGETHESQFRRECEKGLRQHYGPRRSPTSSPTPPSRPSRPSTTPRACSTTPSTWARSSRRWCRPTRASSSSRCSRSSRAKRTCTTPTSWRPTKRTTTPARSSTRRSRSRASRAARACTPAPSSSAATR